MLFALASSLALPQARPQALQPSGIVTTCDAALDTNLVLVRRARKSKIELSNVDFEHCSYC